MRRRTNVMHKSGRGYVTGNIVHGRKKIGVHVSCKGKITLTKQGRRQWNALKRASRCRAKKKAQMKAHRTSRVHHRKAKTHRKNPRSMYKHWWQKLRW